MAKEYYVFSTLSCPQKYTTWTQGGNEIPTPDQHVMIHGGANVPDENFRTPLGVMTKVSEEQLQLLKNNSDFLLHEKNMFITVREKAYDPEVVVADMATRDQSAPLVDNDFADEIEDGLTIKTNGAKPKKENKAATTTDKKPVVQAKQVA